MRVSEGGVSVWYGTPDAPAPSGSVAVGADTSVTIGLQPPDPAASITVLYRINHGAPQTLAAHPLHPAPPHAVPGTQYFQAHFTGLKAGEKVEYVAIYRSGSRQLPSNHEAETHVATFTLAAHRDERAVAHHALEVHHVAVEDPRESLRATLRASTALPSPALEESFIKLYFAHPGTPQSFWEELSKHAEFKSHIDRLQFALQVDVLTSGHIPLIQAVVKRPGVKSMRDIALLDDTVWHDLIAKSGVPPHLQGSSRDPAAFYAASILATLQASFPTLTAARIAASSHHVNPLAVKFLENAADLDIGKTLIDPYVAQHSAAAFNGIPEPNRPAVLKEVKRLQRLFAVSTSSAVLRALLEMGFDSAHAIALVPRASFVDRYAHLLGGTAQATALHERAQFINSRNIHLRTNIQGVIHTPPTRALGHHSSAVMAKTYAAHAAPGGAAPPSALAAPKQTLALAHGAKAMPLTEHALKGPPPKEIHFKPFSLKEDLVKRFPNADELFGTLALCDCSECESAIGPAAYLVDVFDFLGASKPNQHGATPLDVLIGNPAKHVRGRRPDLASMNLTCANTNTSLPYIDIVNEILESYVASGLHLEASAAHDTTDATSAEIDANPQYINQHAYEILDQAVYPFTLPFNRPLLIARSYLNQLGTTRHDILRTFQKDPDSPAVTHLLGAEYLGIGTEEFEILTGQHFDPKQKVRPRPVAEFFGYHGAQMHELTNVSTLLQRTGLSFAELHAIVRTHFINPVQPVGAARELTERIPVNHAALAELIQGNFTHPIETLIPIEAAGISAHELQVLGGAQFDHIKKTVVIDEAGANCDPAAMRMCYFDGTPLSEQVYDRIHRFVRLYRRAGWKIVDLDRAITALGENDITPSLIDHLAHAKQLQTDHHVTNLQILLALWAPIETRGADSLYRALFLSKAKHHQGVDAAFEQEYPDSPVLTDPKQVLADHLPILQSGLRISASDMVLILSDCGLDPATAPLDLNNVSALYRRAALAKTLHLKVRDALLIKALTGGDPFASPEQTLRFAAVAAKIGRSGLTAAQASYVIRHVSVGSAPGETDPRDAVIFDLARTLREGLTAIAQDNVDAPDPTGALTQKKLSLLFESSVVDDILGLINGVVAYSAPLVVLPKEATFPPTLSKKVRYDPIAQLLYCSSPLTAAERSTLLSLSTDAAYHAAVDAVYRQPLDLIKNVLGSFLDPTEAQKKLVTDVASLGADLQPVQLDAQGNVTTDPTAARTTVIATKFAYVLGGLLPYLVVQLGSSLLKKTIAESLKITDLLAKTLLTTPALLHSRVDSTQPAAADLQALQTPGLSATYYTTPDQTGTATHDIPLSVAFDGSKASLPKGTGSASWLGMLAPSASGDFEIVIRTNGTPTVWLGDRATPLALVPIPDSGEFESVKVSLKARQLYYFRLDIAGLPADKPVAVLQWQSLTIHKSIVPAAVLYPATTLQAFREIYILLNKAAVVVNALKLSEDEVSFLADAGRGLPALNVNEWPTSRADTTAQAIDTAASAHFAALLRAAEFTAFRRDLPGTDTKLTNLFWSATLDAAVKTLAAVTGWDTPLVQELVGPKGFALTADAFRNERWSIRLQECVRLSTRLGVSAADLFRWSTSSSDFWTLETIGQEIKKCIQGQYDADAWLGVAKPLNDKLREAQRGALIAYLLPRMQLKDSNQLLEYFLIDADMGVCTETSRISLAHSSVQLFVQRCLMNLEDTGAADSVQPHQIDADQWEKWRKHYRYWQANCEVLLYPENWMEQGVRDDKTPFFKALEGDISQQEVSADNVETAYLNYLEKLEQVARLEIIGTFWQDRDPDTGEVVNTLHVFGRTFHAPHLYFYRTLQNFTTWTPWESMQVSIDGDHVMPLIWNRRLYVFWPVFVSKSVPPQTNSIDASQKSVPTQHSQSFWQVSLAWTELKNHKWSAKQVSKKSFDIHPDYFVEDDPARYAKFAYSFKTSTVHGADAASTSLIIRCVFHGPTVTLNHLGWFIFGITIKETTEVVGAFEIGGCNGESVEPIFGTMPWPNPITPPGTDVEALTYVSSHKKKGLTLLQAANEQPTTFLDASPTPYRLLYPHQFSDYLLQAPLFYQDKHHVFFVSPHEAHGPVHQIAGGHHVTFQRAGVSVAARRKTAAAHGHAAKTPAHQGGQPTRSSRHTASNEVSEVLMELERHLLDLGHPFSQHAAGRRSAWDHHALAHQAHAPSPMALKFETFYHPFVCDFMKSVTRLGVGGLLSASSQHHKASDPSFFSHQYKPTSHVEAPFPTEVVDFDNGPYAIYNQELFFHIPDLIFERLRQNRRYTDALRWLKYIFDPTDDAKDEPAPNRYWKYLPFRTSPRESIQNLLALMESGDEKHSQLLADWAKNPFQPYAIARHRTEAYKKNIFIKYVKTLIEQADSLFLTDSKEAINEAQQLYIMAAHLLGPKPENIAAAATPQPRSYRTLREKADFAAGAIVQLENEFPFSGVVTHHPRADTGAIQGLGQTLYFCAPKNKKLYELWDIVADRLYKIRNCLNFAGVYRQLALFDPPIDPGLLVRAAAAGIDLGSVMADLQAPLPAYRFTYMMQKALEMCNECKAFGSALLMALEKNDAEALAIMRATHEVAVLDLMHRVKIRQVDEANALVDALTASRNTAAQRYGYYQTLMGITGGAVPDPGANIPLIPIPSQPSVDIGGIQLIPEEGLELAISTAASLVEMGAGLAQALAGIAYEFPQIAVLGSPLGVGGSITEGGAQFGASFSAAAASIKAVGEFMALTASLTGKMGNYFRRQAEWTSQNNQAACEIMQIDKQLAAANIRVEIAQRDLEVHEKQMENACKILDFTANQKFTNRELYGWMVSDISSSYFLSYQMAFAFAKKAERTYRFERGLTDSSFIQFGYWDSLRKGLLAADRLYLALLQMQQAYIDQNTRDYEISRDVSLLLNAPLALIALRETGTCEFVLPESFFDADYPGHYMRRLKNVTLTIPCIVGPYTSLNCKLTLLTNKTRISSDPGDQYPEDLEGGDDRFVNNFAAVQSIATSHGQNDSGLFEVNFRDDRYLPFEGAGVVARWRLEMPPENNAFDFETITDVVLQLKYTARDGGDPLRRKAREALASGPQDDLVRLFSLRHEFPGEWHRFLNPSDAAAKALSMTLPWTPDRFPYRLRGKTLSINKVELFLNFKDIHDTQVFTQDGTPRGDYIAGKPLKINVTPPAGTAVGAVLKSVSSVLSGVPHGSADLSDQTAGLGAWTLDVQNDDLGALPATLRNDGGSNKVFRLKSDLVADLVVACHLSVN